MTVSSRIGVVRVARWLKRYPCVRDDSRADRQDAESAVGRNHHETSIHAKLAARYSLTLRASVLFTLASSLTACGDGAIQIPPAQSLEYDTSAPVVAPSGAPVDDWATFAHDMLRSGYQPQPTGISTSSVKSLALRWSYNMGEPVKASPLLVGGVVYVA